MIQLPNRGRGLFSDFKCVSLFLPPPQLCFFSLFLNSILQNNFVFSTDCKRAMSYLPWEFYQHYEEHTLWLTDFTCWSTDKKILLFTQWRKTVKSFVSCCFSSMETKCSVLLAFQNLQGCFSKFGNWANDFKHRQFLIIVSKMTRSFDLHLFHFWTERYHFLLVFQSL